MAEVVSFTDAVRPTYEQEFEEVVVRALLVN